jgi:hypothetical protein
MSDSPSPEKLTQMLNESSVENVRRQIEAKQCYKPFYGLADYAPRVITDYDHFPYTRRFRGVYYSPDPIVMEREAGWRQRQDGCYETYCPGTPMPKPNHCFEGSCSLVTPCYPAELRRYADKQALDLQIDRACIVQYR